MTNLDIYREAGFEFFEELGLKYRRTRERQIVLPLAAFCNALQHKLGPTDIGRIFKVHHSTVLYHFRVHEDRMFYEDYRSLYHLANEKVQEAVLAVRRAEFAIHARYEDNEEVMKMLDVIGNESWLALDNLVEKLYEEFGIKCVSTKALSVEVDSMSKKIGNMLLRHVELQEM